MEFQNLPELKQNQFLEEVDIDVNNILNFSINIDNLKLLLTTIIKNQTTLSQKIIDLENKLKEKRSRSSSMKYKEQNLSRKSTLKLTKKGSLSQPLTDEKLKDRKESAESGLEKKEEKIDKEKKEKDLDKEKENGGDISGINEQEKKEQKDIDNNNINYEKENENEENGIMEKIKEESKDNDQNDEDENLYLSINSTKINDMENKINILEKKIRNLELLNKVNKFTGQGGVGGDTVELMKIEMSNLKDSNKKLLEENLEFKKQFEDINVKLADINIYDLFKDLNASDGSIDIAKGLIMNLENKVFKKISFMDERDKKINQDIMDLKTNIQNVVNKNGVISFNMDNIKKNFKELGELVSNNSNETTNMINNLETKLNNMNKDLIEKFSDERNNLDLNIKKLTDKLGNLEKLNNDNLNPNALKNNNPEFTEENLQFITKMANRINEIESKINTILEESQSFATKHDTIKIEKELIKKVNTKEFFELKDKYNLQLAKINNLDDSTQRLQDLNEKNSSDLIFYAKRVESITSNIISLRSQVEDLIKKEKNKVLDLSLFLDKTTFNKYLKTLQPEKMKIDNNFEELRKLINDISDNLTTKCNADDLKIFEDIIKGKIEELKLFNSRKYADKIDTNRSMKYLDSQIRHIIEIYLKKSDKNESWLIAKKPMGGYSCASCESYIGDLKNKESYMPWNKYPQREKDQNYRVGNGFSRMLNMLNIELKNNDISNEKENESDDDVKKYFEENRIKIRIKNSTSNRDIKDRFNKNNMSGLLKSNSNSNIFNSHSTSKNTNTNILPKLYLNKNDDISTIEPNSPILNDIGFDKNIFESNVEENKETKENNEQQPHIVKIFKKVKGIVNIPDKSKTERLYSNNKK